MITPLLPRDGCTARTAIQAHAVNLIEIRLGKMGRCSPPGAHLSFILPLSKERFRYQLHIRFQTFVIIIGINQEKQARFQGFGSGGGDIQIQSSFMGSL